MGAFVNLPKELLSSIATFLDYSWDLNSLSRVNHYLHDLLDPCLHRHKQQYSPLSTLLWAAEHGSQSVIPRLLADNHGFFAGGKDTPLIRALELAAKYGHDPIVALLLDARSQFGLSNETPAFSDTLDYLLWLAAKGGHGDLTRILLKRGANPTTVIPLGSIHPYRLLPQESLFVAIAQGHLSAVVAILSWMGTAETSRDPRFLANLLLQAATKGQSDIVLYLLRKGANPCLCDSKEHHIMWHAAARCSEDAIRCLLEHGGDPHPPSSPENGSPLRFALQNGKLPGVMVLLSKMFDGDSIPDSHEDPEFMCAAAACGSTDILEKLLQNGADPNAAIEDCRARSCFKPEINCTALRWAIGYKQESAIRLLLESGAKPTPQALIDALQNSPVSIVELLLDSGLDANEFRENRRRYLCTGSIDESLLELLFDNNSDLNIRARRHTLTMFEALKAGQAGQAQILLDRGQRLELPEGYPSPSALLDAAALGGLLTLEFLFNNGFKVVPERGDSHAVLSAIRKHDPEALKFLLQKNVGLPPSQTLASGVDSMLRNLKPNPPLFSHGTSESARAILDLLLSYDFDINSRQEESLGKAGQTCLWTAIERRDAMVARILLDRGASPLLRGTNDEMPLSVAVRLGFAEGVRMLLEWFDTEGYGNIARSDWVALLSKALFHAQSKELWTIVRSLERFIYSRELHFLVSVAVENLATEKAVKELAESEAAKSQPELRPGQRIYRQDVRERWRPVPTYNGEDPYDITKPIHFSFVPPSGSSLNE